MRGSGGTSSTGDKGSRGASPTTTTQPLLVEPSPTTPSPSNANTATRRRTGSKGGGANTSAAAAVVGGGGKRKVPSRTASPLSSSSPLVKSLPVAGKKKSSDSRDSAKKKKNTKSGGPRGRTNSKGRGGRSPASEGDGDGGGGGQRVRIQEPEDGGAGLSRRGRPLRRTSPAQAGSTLPSPFSLMQRRQIPYATGDDLPRLAIPSSQYYGGLGGGGSGGGDVYVYGGGGAVAPPSLGLAGPYPAPPPTVFSLPTTAAAVGPAPVVTAVSAAPMAASPVAAAQPTLLQQQQQQQRQHAYHLYPHQHIRHRHHNRARSHSVGRSEVSARRSPRRTLSNHRHHPHLAGRTASSVSVGSNMYNHAPGGKHDLYGVPDTTHSLGGHSAHHHHHHHHSRHHHGHHHHPDLDATPVLQPVRDSLGNIAYQRIFSGNPFDDTADLPGGGGGIGSPFSQEDPMSDVPWELRDTSAESNGCRYFSFLSTKYFWLLVQWAARVTLISMLVPAVLINLDLRNSPFISNTFALSSVVLATGINFGQSSLFFVQYMKAGCIWLPIATACAAVKLNHTLAVWFVVYTLVLFLMAAFTEMTTRRICLMQFNISMVALLSGNEDLTFPSRVLSDWFIGAAFALVATLLPYPMLATRSSAHISKKTFGCTATCFTGILVCFWAQSNTERSMSMVRIRHLVRSIDHLIDQFHEYDAHTFYEVLFFERAEHREVRKKKVDLLLKLKMNLRAMERVINMVQERPQMLDQSERCLLFRKHLSQPMDAISRTMETLLARLSAAKMYNDMRDLSPYFEASGRAIKGLQEEFDAARRILFYENEEPRHFATSTTALRYAAAVETDGNNVLGEGGGGGGGAGEVDNQNGKADEFGAAGNRYGGNVVIFTADDERMEEFVPLMTFFVFSIVNFWSTLDEFQTHIERHESIHDWQRSFWLIFDALLQPFVENVLLVKNLCVRRAEPELRIVVEAAKVSVSMLISVLFFYYVDDQSLLLSGPTIIAFVSGTNPVEAVRASAARLSGTLFGSVLGFFAASLCHTAADRVAALCVITFAMTFFRTDKKIGTICMYCNFVSVSSLGPPNTSAEATISRIQQNTFAIAIYCFLSIAVFPVSPNQALFEKRLKVVKGVSDTVKKLMGLLNEASACYVAADMQAREHHQHGPPHTLDNNAFHGLGTALDTSSVHVDVYDGGIGGMELRRSRVFLPGDGGGGSAATTALPSGGNSLGAGSRGLHREYSAHGDIVSISAMNRGSPGGRSGGGGGVLAHRHGVMPATFIMAPEDTTIQSIFADIFDMLDVMKTAADIMPLAAEEFTIIPREYPLRATGDVNAALYRLCALVYTMTCCWKTMREKGYFTREVIHIFHNLAPLATDITICLERFSNILAFYVHHPSSGLSSELTKAVMQLRVLCIEFSARKERNLLAVIRKTRMEKGIRESPQATPSLSEEGGRPRRNGRGGRRSHLRRNDSSGGGSGSGSGTAWWGGGGGPANQRTRQREGGSGEGGEKNEDHDAAHGSGGSGGGGREEGGEGEAVGGGEGGPLESDRIHWGQPGEGSHGEAKDVLLSSHSQPSHSALMLTSQTCIFDRERDPKNNNNSGDDVKGTGGGSGNTPFRHVAPPTTSAADGDKKGRKGSRDNLHGRSSSNNKSADRIAREQQLREDLHRSHHASRRASVDWMAGSLSAHPSGGGQGALMGSRGQSREDLLFEEQLMRGYNNNSSSGSGNAGRAQNRGKANNNNNNSNSTAEKRTSHKSGGARGASKHHGQLHSASGGLGGETEASARHADSALSLPYGSREADMNALPFEGAGTEAAQINFMSLHESDREGRSKDRRGGGGRRGRTRGADRITLPSDSDSNGDGDDDRSYSSLSYSSSYSSGGGSSRSSSSGYSSDDGDWGVSTSPSMVRFNDSFTTPVTVHDAEGLHAFTLSLEMLTRELRKVLFGLEEMLQSQ